MNTTENNKQMSQEAQNLYNKVSKYINADEVVYNIRENFAALFDFETYHNAKLNVVKMFPQHAEQICDIFDEILNSLSVMESASLKDVIYIAEDKIIDMSEDFKKVFWKAFASDEIMG